MISELLQLLFPPRCRICGAWGTALICEECFDKFPRITPHTICERCGKPGIYKTKTCVECSGKVLHYTQARSAGSYEGPLKEAVRQLKYKNGKLLAPLLASFMPEIANETMAKADAISFVPITKRKEAERGYNQSHLLAKQLARSNDKPLMDFLIRLDGAKEQNKLDLSAREKNVQGAFKAKGAIKGSILLIDDVFTTGNTSNECARILRDGGAGNVYVLTLARALLLSR